MKHSSVASIVLLANHAVAFVSRSAIIGTGNDKMLQQAQPPVAATSKSSMFDTYFVEEENALSTTSSFSIPPEQLMERARQVLSPQVGLGTKDGGECLADDFEFVAAVVGPIGKKEYLNALGTFDLESAFDIKANFYGMSVDPMQPNRVWVFNRVKANHTGTFMGAGPTGKEIVYPPQIHHLDFNEQGKLVEYGFYTCDRRQGNTGGLGGALVSCMGSEKPLPIPECQPYKPSFRFRMLNFLGRLGQKLQKKEE